MATPTGLVDVHDALRQAGLVDGANQRVSMHRLSGGLTNDNILVTIASDPDCSSTPRPSRKVVLRRFRQETSRYLHYDRCIEAENTTKAANGGIGPGVVAFLPASGQHGGGLVIEYIQGTTLDETHIRRLCMQSQASARRLAEALSRLHDCVPFSNTFDACHARHLYVNECIGLARRSTCDDALWPGFGDVLARLQPLEQRLQSLNEGTVPCHNDLLAANFIANSTIEDQIGPDGALFIIDYELSGMAPASWELGNIISENGSEEEEQAVRNLVEQYWCLRLEALSRSSADGRDTEKIHQAQILVEQVDVWIESRIARARAWALVSKVTWAAWGRVLNLLACKTAAEQETATTGTASADTMQGDPSPAFDYAAWSLAKLHRAETMLADTKGMTQLMDALWRDELDDIL